MTSAREAVSLTLAFGLEFPVKVGYVLPLTDENGVMLCMVRVTSIAFGEGDEIEFRLEVVQE